MTSLFVLSEQYRADARKLADLDLDPQTLADTLEAMSGEVEIKSQSVAHVIRAIESDAAAVKQWAKDAAERAKALEARAERLRDYLAGAMTVCGIEKIEGPGVKLSWRKSSAVVIDDVSMLPAEYMTTPKPPEPAPDKAAIKKAIEANKDVPGARIEHRHNLQIG